MKKYVVSVHTEELRGRLSSTRLAKCRTREDAEQVLEREYDALCRKHVLFVDEDIDDNTRVVEYFPKMRTTLSIVEA